MKNQYFSSHVLMVRPHRFYCNQQTLSDNIYQVESKQTAEQVNQKALKQFDNFVQKLHSQKVTVTVVQDPGINKTPDSIFPNNWISFHQKNQYITYPMCPVNRRKQREITVVQQIQKQLNNKFDLIHDYSHFQNQNLFLQGTGSMVLDRQNKIVYAVLSQRTSNEMLQRFCTDMNYQKCSFHASQYCAQKQQYIPIYHTNVLMSVSRDFVIISLELIQNKTERKEVERFIKQKSKKQLIQLSADQILHFAGNTITLVNLQNKDLMIISQNSYQTLNENQIQKLSQYVKFVVVNLQTIQQNGGGSARCMLAQIY